MDGRYQDILNRYHSALAPQLVGGRRIRCHGKFRLAHLLVSGQDLIPSDFEGSTDCPVGERRIKRSPLYDVARMLRSFDYAVTSAMLDLSKKPNTKQGVIRDEDREKLSPYSLVWRTRLREEFVSVYTRELEASGLLP